jgi:uncharacterized protein YukE
MYDPNVCTPTMFEDELRALSSMSSFTDPEMESRLQAVAELRRAIQAVREIPGWTGDSVGEAQVLLERMEKNATAIETALTDMRSGLRRAADSAAGAASAALRRLPSASADGFIADAQRNLAGITDGWGAFDTGEAVAREEARLAAEREAAAIEELKAIRGSLTGEARQNFQDPGTVTVNTSSVPLPVIDVDGIDSRVPSVGSNGPSAGGGSPQGGTGGGTWTAQPGGGWVPGGDGGSGVGNGGSGGGNGGSGGGNGGSVGDTEFGNGGSGGGNGGGGVGTGGDNGWGTVDPGGSGSGGAGDPSVDSPIGGTLPGYPGGGGASGSGGGGGLLTGGSGGSGTLGAAVVGGAGAAALLGTRSASLGGTGGASLFGGGGSGAGAGAGAATAGRGLLGMSGATGPGGIGAAGSASGSASGSAGGSAAGAGGRSMAPGMMGGAGDDEKRRERSGLGGPIAPKLEDDEETGPRSRSAQAGSRDTLR